MKEAENIGFPIMVEASSGGGGKGMRISESRDDFEENFSTAQRESVNAFADNTMYLERMWADRATLRYRSSRPVRSGGAVGRA